MVFASTALAACGSAAAGRHSSAGADRAGSVTPGASALGYARCMRAHSVTRFPDPAANGAIDLRTSGLNLSSPAARAAARACHALLPQKHSSRQQPTAGAYARLLAWAECMRRHGISGLPDPRPDPVPGPGSPATNRYGTVMGDGGYWVGIPYGADAHSPAFVRRSATCGESPRGPTHPHG